MLTRRLLLTTALVAASATLPGTVRADETIKVVATFSILGDMVDAVGGDAIELTTLVGPGGDAHVYQPTPQDAKAVSEADVLMINGLEFEGWLERLIGATSFDGKMVVATDGIEAIEFGGHDDDHGDEHGGHAFEWGGLFDLKAGTYNWSFAKVDGDYADPAMRMVVLAAEDIEAVEEDAEDMLEADAAEDKADGDTLSVSETAFALNFDADKDVTVFSVNIAEDGKYAFFTEHMPFEFEADEHFFKDTSGADVEPVAQEPDGDHHDHGHGHEDHAGHDDHKDHDDHAGHDDHKDHDDHAGHDDHDDHKDHDDHAGHDDHHGHNHGAFDPHAWQSVENAMIYVDNIANGLAQADPDNASAFFKNREAYVAELEALETEISSLMAELAEDKRTVVTSHDAFGYFAEAYSLEFEAPQGVSTESEASAGEVAELITQIRDEGIAAVFVETITDNRLMEQIASETQAVIGGTLYSDALSDADGPASTYLEMMRYNAATISKALTGS